MYRTVAAGSMIKTGEEELRKCLANMAAGVALIAVRGPNGLPRFTVASAFNSVSLEPPVLLWCVRADEWEALGLSVNSSCGISVLSDADVHLAGTVGRGSEAIWECGDFLGVPVLSRTAASFEVVVTRCLPQGKNILCFGEVAVFSQIS
jgi:flavin reductase (DIM6/NTAB) family NADH-FMN oxidoreductase RutF